MPSRASHLSEEVRSGAHHSHPPASPIPPRNHPQLVEKTGVACSGINPTMSCSLVTSFKYAILTARADARLSRPVLTTKVVECGAKATNCRVDCLECQANRARAGRRQRPPAFHRVDNCPPSRVSRYQVVNNLIPRAVLLRRSVRLPPEETLKVTPCSALLNLVGHS